MIDYIVLSPSYKRASTCTSHNFFLKEKFQYAVHEFEAQQYRDAGHSVFVLPDSIRGNIARVRNYLLEHSPRRYLLMVDDDFQDFFWVLTKISHREKQTLSASNLDALIQNGFVMADDSGASLWGVNMAHDPRFYTQNRPFSLSLPVLGTFSGHILDSGIRYDETLPLKEDYDFFIKTLEEKRIVLRLNFLMYQVDHQKLAGGCQEYRTEELEEDNFQRLQQKWGSDIVKRGASSKGQDINPVIRRPI